MHLRDFKFAERVLVWIQIHYFKNKLHASEDELRDNSLPRGIFTYERLL